MSWLRRYKFRLYVQNSIWILPASGMVTALIAVNLLDGVEKRVGWASNFDVDAFRTRFSILAGSLLTFIVFLSSSLPPDRAALLRGELKLLQRSAGRSFPEPEDQARAGVSDSQGNGRKPGLVIKTRHQRRNISDGTTGKS